MVCRSSPAFHHISSALALACRPADCIRHSRSTHEHTITVLRCLQRAALSRDNAVKPDLLGNCCVHVFTFPRHTMRPTRKCSEALWHLLHPGSGAMRAGLPRSQPSNRLTAAVERTMLTQEKVLPTLGDHAVICCHDSSSSCEHHRDAQQVLVQLSPSLTKLRPSFGVGSTTALCGRICQNERAWTKLHAEVVAIQSEANNCCHTQSLQVLHANMRLRHRQ